MVDKKKVLLVDDDVDFVEMNKTILEANGYETAAAHNTKDGIAAADDFDPDVIVLDVMMDTKSDGFHAAYELRHSEKHKDVPIIMVTGVNNHVPYTFDKDETWLPVDEFIEKPIKPERLLAEVEARVGA